ncbi:MAG: hypothetical protein ASARMPREDX12_001426 [Alectoria sarmentosa]|nr:MAG: hypothetical protein ASARMPREDX12_001426 [Alectoria sarmentosa]
MILTNTELVALSLLLFKVSQALLAIRFFKSRKPTQIVITSSNSHADQSPRDRDISEMSRTGPAPGRNLHGGGDDGLGYGQRISDPHQKFTAKGDRQRPFDRTGSFSGSPSSGGQEIDGHDSQRHCPRLAIPLPNPGTSSELDFWQNSEDLAQRSPGDENVPLEQEFKKPVPKVIHPACLTPGHRDVSQEIYQDQQETHRPSASVKAPDSETSTLASATRPLLQTAVPPGLSTNANPREFSRDSQTPFTTAAGATPAPRRLRWGPTSEDYPSVPSTQGIGSRYPAQAGPIHTSERANSRTEVGQDELFGLLTHEEDAAMRGEVILRGDGYRLLDVQHHPEISQMAHPARQAATAAVGVPEHFIRSGRRAENRTSIWVQTPQNTEPTPTEDSAPISSTDPQASTTSSATNSPITTLSSTSSLSSPPSPPPRVSCDVVERNSFEAATHFYFFAENVGRGDIEDSEDFAAVDVDGGAEVGARRLSLKWQEWGEWWERLGEVGKWTVGFEEVGDWGVGR